jgi:small-conductance mechanosensitive channel
MDGVVPMVWSSIVGVFRNPVYGSLIIAAFILVAAWGSARAVRFLIARAQKRVEAKATHLPNAAVSTAETRFDMLRRIANAGIYFLAVMFILFLIPPVRAIGATLLATAGLVGIVAGLAAQATLSNLIAGIAIAFSQPVRLGDAVIYNDDWGWIEEITLMHTVIRTWDNRRLVVPNSVLNSTVIQNWTLKEEWLLGVVMLYVDYTCDVDQVRRWAEEIIEQSPYSTDEHVATTQVVDFTEKSMVVRILGKSADASSAWNLRCELREKLIARFRQAGLPLPRIRVAEPMSGPTEPQIE